MNSRKDSNLAANDSVNVHRRSLPGATRRSAGVNGSTRLGHGAIPELMAGEFARSSRQMTPPSRCRHQASRPGFLFVFCMLYFASSSSCQQLGDSLLSSGRFGQGGGTVSRGSRSPHSLLSGVDPAVADGTQDGQASCRLSSTFHRVITTDCVMCPLSKPTLCPAGTVPITQGSGDRGCTVPSVSGISMEIVGCSHRCQWTENRYECCTGFWGPMCTECPGGTNNPCNSRGSCQGNTQATQCQCSPAFTGVSCELCARDNVYGPDCDQECDCVYGVCNAGATGNGFCLCDAGYQGPRCDQAKISCGEPACHLFAICSPPVTNGQDPQCVCSPGYSGDGRLSCIENDPCGVEGVCSLKALCIHVSPGRHTCVCLEGYYGDGVECYPINYCQQQFPPCPSPSSTCVFDGPRRYHCECREGYQNYNFPAGCQRVDACAGPDAPECQPHSVCVMTLQGQARCECLEGFTGDGQACYGSIMEVLRDLNSDPTGSLQGSLTTAISMLELTMGYLLSGDGLFTVLVPTELAFQRADYELYDRAFRDVDFARYLVKLHTVPTYMDAYTLNTTSPIYTLAGIRAEVTHKDGNPERLRYRLEGSNRRAILTHVDIPAANGVIHIIDNVLYEPSRVENNLEGSVTDVLSTASRFNRFYTFLTSVGLHQVIPSQGPCTILAPMNKAFRQLPEGSEDFLMSAQGRPKLLALLQNHIVQGEKLLMQDLITAGRVISQHGATTNFHIYPNGLIGMDGGANMTFSDIITNDGYIHSIDGLLVPSDIDPLIPNRCDRESFALETGPCASCNDTILPTSCPSGSTAVSRETHSCLLEVPWQGGSVITLGCQLMCNRTTWEPECCAGFHGEVCHPCPGGFAVPCNGHGQCADGSLGAGVCTCEVSFTGTACELCAPRFFGPGCNETCSCIHGICYDGPQGTGHCKGGCDIGYTGQDCTVPAEGCGPELHICHERAVCDTSGFEIRCICQAGYSGSGLHCEPLNQCQLPDRGSCHRQAFCTYTGPGLSDCTCNPGWQGDGFECDAVNPCEAPNHGGCDAGAICAYIRPGVSRCYCNLGYQGNGTVCEPINPCLLMTNGGCDAQAFCVHTGPGTSDCQCGDGYGGDGWLCYQSLPLEIATIPTLRKFSSLIQLADMERYLASAPALTVFAPTDDAITLHEDRFGPITPLQAMSLVQMHIVNGTHSERDLYRLAFDDDQYIQSLFPSYGIQVHDCDHHLCVNDIQVQLSDIPATNGLVHILGQVLVPGGDGIVPFGGDFGPSGFLPPSFLPFGQLVDQTEPNSTFYELLQQYGVVDSINAAFAYTVFFPSNEAIASFNASRITRDILRYHLVLGQAWTVADIYNGMHIDTALGHNYQLRFRKELGSLFVNNVPVTSPDLTAVHGIVHMMSEVLVPLPNRCDLNRTTLTQTACGSCSSVPDCPTGTTPLVNPGMSSCQYDIFVRGLGTITVDGCRVHCRGLTYVPECCSGFYGAECAECPGGWSSPCNGHGSCLQGTNGTGACRCFPHFTGTACELCEPGMFGPLCEQVCYCANGRCREGLHGDGRCICDQGYTGIQCDTRITDATSCNVQCDVNAYCLEQHCICYHGYTGNGTHCTVYDPCSEDGMCSEHASCHNAIGGQAECRCLLGYQGDGVYCEEVNPCLDGDDGGCHELAECIHTGPAMSTCHCQQGYEGNGRTRCSPIDPCQEDNGGCDARAHCRPAGPGLRNCTCFEGHIGDGLQCTGNIAEELALNANVSTFHSLLEEFRDVERLLGSVGPLTILVPSNEAFEHIGQQQIEDWREDNQLSRVLMNHVVGCSAFLTPDLNSSTSLITLSAQPIQVTYSSAQGVLVNRDAHVTTANFVTSNGIMHTIDRVLVPRLLDPRPEYLEELPLALVASNSTYSIFLDLMDRMNPLDGFQTAMSLPVTVFMPTDEAFLDLYPGKLDELRDPANAGVLREYLAYHIVPHRTIKTTQLAQGLQGLTLQGSNITIECQRNQGFVINRDSKIIDTETPFRDGVFYALDMVLEPPSIGGRCDIMHNNTFSTDCHHCDRTIACPPGSLPIGKNIQDCFISVGWYNYRPGCLRHCIRQEREPNCCNQHYGPDCRECPGGKRNPCSWHGICDDGNTGTGSCRCDEGFTGVACELCQPERFGPSCAECQCTINGQCNDGLSGTGSCFCDVDYMGTNCETRLPVTPVCNPYCHINAVCRPGNVCECRPEYYGNGYSCTVINQCSFDNGGCSMFADCTQVDTQVMCRCLDNYEGDGIICQPIDPCMVNHGGCPSDATCKLTGPNSRSCTCNPPLQGDGIFCVAPDPSARSACTIDNGGCHENALCFDGTSDPLGPAPGHPGPPGHPDRHPGMPPPGYPQRPPPHPTPPLGGDGLDPHARRGVRCQCKPGYVGTGLLCNGNAFETLASIKDLSIYYLALVRYARQYPEGIKLVDALRSERSKLTLFIPINSDALANTTFTAPLIGSHVVYGQAYDKKQLEQGLSLVAWSKVKLTVEMSSDKKLILVNDVPVRVFDIPTTNGILHIVSGPINMKHGDDNLKPNSKANHVSVSKLFAGVLITIFVIILLIIIGFAIFIKVRRKKTSGTRTVISRYSVNGGNYDGCVTFSRTNILAEGEGEGEEDGSETTSHNPTFHNPAYHSTDMNSDTVGFAELDFTRAY